MHHSSAHLSASMSQLNPKKADIVNKAERADEEVTCYLQESPGTEM